MHIPRQTERVLYQKSSSQGRSGCRFRSATTDVTDHGLGPSTAQRSKLLPPALLEIFYFCSNHKKSSVLVCLAGYLGLVPILRKNKHCFPFLCYYLFPVRRIGIRACHTSQGNYPENIPPGSGRSTHGFGAQQDHKGPQDITQGIGNRAGNGAWVSCVLHPLTSLVLRGLGISHSLVMSTT